MQSRPLVVHVTWTLSTDPTDDNLVAHTCQRCRHPNAIPTGKLRVNANGKKHDVWCLVRCARCDRTHKLRLQRRVAAHAVEHSLPQVEPLPRSTPCFEARGPTLEDLRGTVVEGRFLLGEGVRVRLDRALGQALGVPRSLLARWRAEGVVVADGHRRQWRRAVTEDVRVVLRLPG
jgi:hypothetical protein